MEQEAWIPSSDLTPSNSVQMQTEDGAIFSSILPGIGHDEMHGSLNPAKEFSRRRRNTIKKDGAKYVDIDDLDVAPAVYHKDDILQFSNKLAIGIIVNEKPIKENQEPSEFDAPGLFFCFFETGGKKTKSALKKFV